MNKKISIPLIPIIIAVIVIVIIVVVIIVKGTQDGISKLSKVYNKMIEGQTYAFVSHNFEEKNKKITYRKVDKTLIDQYDFGERLSTLIMGGDTYLVIHNDKEYYFYPNNNSEQEILTDELKKMLDLEYTTGKEKIYGRTYNYEEYQGVSSFFVFSENGIDANPVKTRFYFKGNELAYLKIIYETIDEETGEKTQVEELQTVKIEYEVEDAIFEIPSDYAEN